MNRTILVGSTGFVGTNLMAACQFDGAYHSTDVQEAYGSRPELLIYAGIRAEKYLANKNPKQDLAQIHSALRNIREINARKTVLISTIDVYANPFNVDEQTIPNSTGLQPYGANRLWLEEQVLQSVDNCLIVRLPALFGMNLKKNFLYDFIHRIPSALTEAKFTELAEKERQLAEYYTPQGNGFYRCRELSRAEKFKLKGIFDALNFSALNFTDSRSVYQFYNLSFLWDHIQKALQHSIKILNIATEPVSAAEIYRFLTGEIFNNHLETEPPYYNFKTIYAPLYGERDGYLMDKGTVLQQIKAFTSSYMEY